MSLVGAADPAKSSDLLNQAKSLAAAGRGAEAIKAATAAIDADPGAGAYFFRAQLFEGSHDLAKALSDYDQGLKLAPRQADAWQHRGLVHFKLGHIKESIADFDQYLLLVPEQAPYHWQRGISCYYAGRFEDGRKQFELHQTVNPADVENAVWHFLCVTRSAGLETARAKLIPISGDPRVPMHQIHALFAGQAKPEEVLQAARAGEPSEPELQRRLFYAHLYLGLYFEAIGDNVQARAHLTKAAGPYRTEDYMGEVARVHVQLRSR